MNPTDLLAGSFRNDTSAASLTLVQEDNLSPSYLTLLEIQQTPVILTCHSEALRGIFRL